MTPDQPTQVRTSPATAPIPRTTPGEGHWVPARDHDGATMINRAALRAWLIGQPYAEEDTATRPAAPASD